jgi:hypothetical protein
VNISELLRHSWRIFGLVMLLPSHVSMSAGGTDMVHFHICQCTIDIQRPEDRDPFPDHRVLSKFAKQK